MSDATSDNPQSAIRNPQSSPLTDSSWFWARGFSLMGLVALAAMAGKYGRRQANIERNYQARWRVAEKLTAENKSDAAGRIERPDAQPSYATPDCHVHG